MNTIAHGVDIVEVARIARMLEEHSERFRERCFTEEECAYAEAGGQVRAQRYAARFAAKEAVLKAIGTGWQYGIAWTDVEVVRSAEGAPGVVLRGEAARRASERGISGWLLSLSHTETHAMASAIGLGLDG